MEKLVAQDTMEINQFLRQLDAQLEAARQPLPTDVFRQPKQIEWNSVLDKSIDRHDDLCSICIQPLIRCTTGDLNDPFYNPRPLSLLCCSHVFHWKCIECFENFDIDKIHVCPVCRCHYQKKRIDEVAYL